MMETGVEQKAVVVADRVRRDPHAPYYHFVAPEGDAMPFDPNGALHWRGRYHLFYIFQDDRLCHDDLQGGEHAWGHASSEDLFRWTFHPTALTSRDGSSGTGIFSGCGLIDKGGVPALMYHGVEAGTCMAAPADDDLICWSPSPHNPVIRVPNEGEPGWGQYNVFDPHCWIEADRYHMILGGKVKPHDRYDTAYLFTSEDLVDWRYERPFYEPRPEWTDPGEDCACPDFFRLGHRWVLMCISHRRGLRYYLGDLRDGRFVPQEHHRMNWPGGTCFASESLVDGRDRRIMWAWVIDQRSGPKGDARRLGVMTLPRVLRMGPDGQLRIEPVEEITKLRRGHTRLEDISIASGSETGIEEVQGDGLELVLRFRPGLSRRFGLTVMQAPDGSEQTRIVLDRDDETIAIDTSRSSLSCDVFRPFPLFEDDAADYPVQTAPIVIDPSGAVTLRVFVDRSIVEVFVDDRQCVTQRIYPTLRSAMGISAFSEDGSIMIESIDAYEMARVNLGE